MSDDVVFSAPAVDRLRAWLDARVNGVPVWVTSKEVAAEMRVSKHTTGYCFGVMATADPVFKVEPWSSTKNATRWRVERKAWSEKCDCGHSRRSHSQEGSCCANDANFDNPGPVHTCDCPRFSTTKMARLSEWGAKEATP